MVCTVNLKDGLNTGYNMVLHLHLHHISIYFNLNFKKRGWAYQIERALGTRPPKVARAIAKHKTGNVPKLEKLFDSVLASKVGVNVLWEEFIHENEFLNWLEEDQYLNVMENASYLFISFYLLLYL